MRFRLSFSASFPPPSFQGSFRGPVACYALRAGRWAVLWETSWPSVANTSSRTLVSFCAAYAPYKTAVQLRIHQNPNGIGRFSNIIECGPKSIEFCSMDAASVGEPKPSGLGMVSIFTMSAARTAIGPILRIDVCRVGMQSRNFRRWLCSAWA
jgi:hypothetical protein